jgi:RHH-type proline utilization regulon transcriptional repressor/proline dehydrogenase/delta 1-pyrroline-5-carboxylate dehydrogenase
MLFGAMDVLQLGDPWLLSTDVGSVISAEAQKSLCDYIEQARSKGRVLKELDTPLGGFFVAPTVIRVEGIEELSREVFGPVLHVARYSGKVLAKVVESINATGFGLTLGLHTRIDSRVQEVIDLARVGNLYVNRDQIGAVVGSQPFGGERLSGTGPKAGGPLYLPRFRKRIEDTTDRYALTRHSGPTIGCEKLRDTIAALKRDDWTPKTHRMDILREVLDGQKADALAAAATIVSDPRTLPGPTGESNQYWLAPKGVVLCLGSDANVLMSQSIQALAAGNRVVVVGPAEITKRIEPLQEVGVPIGALTGEVEPQALVEGPIDMVAFAGRKEDLGSLRRILADRPGAILPLVMDEISPESYCHERSICIDTTATGGNVSLMTLQAS